MDVLFITLPVMSKRKSIQEKEEAPDRGDKRVEFAEPLVNTDLYNIVDRHSDPKERLAFALDNTVEIKTIKQVIQKINCLRIVSDPFVKEE